MQRRSRPTAFAAGNGAARLEQLDDHQQRQVGIVVAAAVISFVLVLVSIMMANNEVGTVQPIAGLARVARTHGARFHTDAVQAFGKLPVDVDALGADALL